MQVCFISISAYGYFNQDKYAAAAGGGAQRQLHLLSQELKEKHDVHFVVGDYGQAQTEQREGVTLHRSFRPVGSTFKKPVEMGKLFAAMRRADADIYISRNRPPMALFSHVCSRLLGRRWVFNVANDRYVRQSLDYLPAPVRWGYVRTLQHADGVIAQSDHQQSSLREGFGVESTVVPNGYVRADETVGHDRRDIFLWVGRLDPEQKRPGLFLDLAERVPSAEFLLIGARGDEQVRERLTKRMAGMDNVRYRFDVPPDEVHEYFRNAYALVNTSAHEGFPNTFLEAWRVGTPVLSLRVDPDRFLEQGPDVFADGDTTSLAATVEKLYSKPAFWRTISKTARERFEETYAMSTVADQYATALENAAE